jgi:hypothetical protein
VLCVVACVAGHSHATRESFIRPAIPLGGSTTSLAAFAAASPEVGRSILPIKGGA